MALTLQQVVTFFILLPRLPDNAVMQTCSSILYSIMLRSACCMSLIRGQLSMSYHTVGCSDLDHKLLEDASDAAVWCAVTIAATRCTVLLAPY